MKDNPTVIRLDGPRGRDQDRTRLRDELASVRWHDREGADVICHLLDDLYVANAYRRAEDREVVRLRRSMRTPRGA